MCVNVYVYVVKNFEENKTVIFIILMWSCIYVQWLSQQNMVLARFYVITDGMILHASVTVWAIFTGVVVIVLGILHVVVASEDNNRLSSFVMDCVAVVLWSGDEIDFCPLLVLVFISLWMCFKTSLDTSV